jgi:hypothetical protein
MGMVYVDRHVTGATLPHCARCGDVLEPCELGAHPSAFCSDCLADIFASADSFGGSIGDFANRYNTKVLSFLGGGEEYPRQRRTA